MFLSRPNSSVLLTFFLAACLATAQKTADRKASTLTKTLFENLRQTAKQGRTLIGSDSATYLGEFLRDGPCDFVDWDGAPDGFRSDIRDICNNGPGIYGFDVWEITGDKFIGDPDSKQLVAKATALFRSHMQAIFSRGGVITVHWHVANPIDNSDSWKGPRELWKLVPRARCNRNPHLAERPDCGAVHGVIAAKVNTLAKFFKSVQDAQGEPIPMIFRPFHENNGDWFFWGSQGIDPDLWRASYVEIWKWMVKTFAAKGVHQLLWATGPNGKFDGSLSTKEYLFHSPPLRWVDVLGYDKYGDHGADRTAVNEVRRVVKLAEKKSKVPAITEIGYNFGGDSFVWPNTIFTNNMLGPFLDDAVATCTAWILMWHNVPFGDACGDGVHFGPYDDHPSSSDFAQVCQRNDILMEGDYSFFGTSPTTPGCSTVTCTENRGRGYGDVTSCASGGGKCAVSTSGCECRIQGAPIAPNGIQYCLSKRGCGWGDKFPCEQGGDFTCAKTDDTYVVWCVSFFGSGAAPAKQTS